MVRAGSPGVDEGAGHGFVSLVFFSSRRQIFIVSLSVREKEVYARHELGEEDQSPRMESAVEFSIPAYYLVNGKRVVFGE